MLIWPKGHHLFKVNKIPSVFIHRQCLLQHIMLHIAEFLPFLCIKNNSTQKPGGGQASIKSLLFCIRNIFPTYNGVAPGILDFILLYT